MKSKESPMKSKGLPDEHGNFGRTFWSSVRNFQRSAETFWRNFQKFQWSFVLLIRICMKAIQDKILSRIKLRKGSRDKSNSHYAQHPLDIVHSDICGEEIEIMFCAI
jgi:hypothetical protein